MVPIVLKSEWPKALLTKTKSVAVDICCLSGRDALVYMLKSAVHEQALKNRVLICKLMHYEKLGVKRFVKLKLAEPVALGKY